MLAAVEKTNDLATLLLLMDLRSNYDRRINDLNAAFAERTIQLSESVAKRRLGFEQSPVGLWQGNRQTDREEVPFLDGNQIANAEVVHSLHGSGLVTACGEFGAGI